MPGVRVTPAFPTSAFASLQKYTNSNTQSHSSENAVAPCGENEGDARFHGSTVRLLRRGRGHRGPDTRLLVEGTPFSLSHGPS